MTLAELNALIQARLPDNSRNRITASDLRAVAEALAAAATTNSSTAATSTIRSSAHRLFLFNSFV